MQKNTESRVQAMTKMALCITMICIASYLVVPLPFTPIVLSLHTVAVNLVGLILTPLQAGCTIAVYLLMGLIGLPVFSSGTAGPAKLFGPTGGFYFGFLVSVVVMSLLKGKEIRFLRYLLVTALIGMPIQHFFGVLMMLLHNGFDLRAAITAVSLPFIPGDLIKCVLSSALAVALNKALPRALRGHGSGTHSAS